MVVDLGGFDKRSKELINAMVACGWTGRRTSKGHWLGKAPDGATITVPSKIDNRGRALANAEANFARWLRSQAPESMEALEELATAAVRGTSVADDVLADHISHIGADAIAKEMARKRQPQQIVPVSVVAIANAPERVLVSSRPWLARKTHGPVGGERYESEAVVENHYSDGFIEYVCAFGCGYTNPNPRGVATHFGKAHTSKGQTPPAGEGPRHIDVTYTEPTFHREYNPQDRLVKALSTWLEEHWTAELPMEDIAVMFLTWAHERPDLEHIERDVVAYTDTEMVQRIRAIVGQPFSVELKEATEQISALQAEVIQRTIERDDVTAHLAKVQRDLDAIREMLGGVGS